MPARDSTDTPEMHVVLAAAARAPVCFRAVRALTRGGLARVHFLRRKLPVSEMNG